MMYITRAVAWLVVFSEEENPAALLTDLALLAHEAYDEGLSPQALLKERLEDMFALVPVQDRISKKEIYASMVETYKTMCEDDFGPELLEIYQPEDEPGSEPSDDSADQWVIPLPGEEGTVCRRRTLNSEAGEEPKLETDSPAQVLDSASAGPEASEDQNLIPDMETLDPKWVTTRPRVRYTYAVVKWTPLEDESPSYAIWAARAFSQRDKGVKVVKTCNRLHVAKNYVRQKEGANGPVAQRVASRSLIIYDPDSRVALQEVGKTSFVRDPTLTYEVWLAGLPTMKATGASSDETLSTDQTAVGTKCLSPSDQTIDGSECPSPSRGPDESVAKEEDQVAEVSDTRTEEKTMVGLDVHEPSEMDLDTTSTKVIRFKLKGMRVGAITDPALKIIIRQVKLLGSHVLICTPGIADPCPWLIDTGAELSQIDPATAGRLWTQLTPKGTAWVTAQSAFANTKVQLQFCRLSGCSLVERVGPQGPVFHSPPFDISLVINPKLKNETCILGLWTLNRYSVSIDYSQRSLFFPGVPNGFHFVRVVRDEQQPGANLQVRRPEVEAEDEEGDEPWRNPAGSSLAASRRTNNGSRLAYYADTKRRQLTLRHTWALQRLKSTPTPMDGKPKAKTKVRAVKREHYSPRQKATARRATSRVSDWEREEEELSHRIAMASLTRCDSPTGISEQPEIVDLVDQEDISSGEDSVLGSSARPPDGRRIRTTRSLFLLSDSSEEEPLEAHAKPAEGDDLPMARLVSAARLASLSDPEYGSGRPPSEAGTPAAAHNTLPSTPVAEGIYVTATGSPDVAALFDSPVSPRSGVRTELNGAPARM